MILVFGVIFVTRPMPRDLSIIGISFRSYLRNLKVVLHLLNNSP